MVELRENQIKYIQNSNNPQTMGKQYDNTSPYYNPEFDFYDINGFVKEPDGKEKKQPWTRQQKREVNNRITKEVKDKLTFRESTIYKRWIQSIKNYSLSNIDRALELKAKNREFMTNTKQPIIRTFVDRVVSSLYRGEYTVKVYPTDDEMVEFAKMVEGFAERGFAAADVRRVILDATYDAVLCGTWFAKIGFDAPQEFLDYKRNPEDDKEYVLKKVAPKLTYISPFNILGEPFMDFYDQPIIYRTFGNIKSILAKSKHLFELDKDQIARILQSPQRFSDKNYAKVKLIKYYEDAILAGEDVGTEEDYYKVEANNSLVEYVEYWNKDNLVVALNWYVVYDYINPLGTGNHPFTVFNFSNTSEGRIWDGVWTMLEYIQNQYDSLHNIMFDLAKYKAWPMFMKRPWQHLEWNENHLNYEPFSFVQFTWAPDATIDVFPMPWPDQVNFKMMSDLVDMASFTISPSNYNQIEWVSRSASDASYRQDALRDVILPLSENIGEWMTRMLEQRLLLAKEKMPPKFKIWMFGKDAKLLFRVIDSASLEWNYIYQTEFESVKDINKSNERQKLVELINVIEKVWLDPATNRRLIDMEKFTPYVLSLFSDTEDFTLQKDRFYEMLAESQKKLMAAQWQAQPWQEGQAPATTQVPTPTPEQIPQITPEQQEQFDSAMAQILW